MAASCNASAKEWRVKAEFCDDQFARAPRYGAAWLRNVEVMSAGIDIALAP